MQEVDTTVHLIEYESGKKEIIQCDFFFVCGKTVFLVENFKLTRTITGGKKITVHRGRVQ